MDILDILLAVPIIIGVLTALFVALAYILGSVDGGTWFKVMPNNSVALVVKGDTPVRVITNIKDHYYNDATQEIEPGTEPYVNLVDKFLSLFGIRFVSWMFPIYRLHKFEVNRAKKIKSSITESEDLEAYVTNTDVTKKVDHLRWRVPRVFIYHNVDLADGAGVNVIYEGYVLLKSLAPSVLANIMNEEIFGRLSGLVQGRQKDLVAKHTFDAWFKNKTGEGSPNAKFLSKIKSAPIIGYEPEEGRLWVLDWEENTKTKPLRDAQQKQQIAEREGDALITEKQKFEKASQHEAAGKMALAFVDQAVVIADSLRDRLGADNATQVAIAAMQRDAAGTSKAQVYAPGGSTIPMVQVGAPATGQQTGQSQSASGSGNQSDQTTTTTPAQPKQPPKKTP